MYYGNRNLRKGYSTPPKFFDGNLVMANSRGPHVGETTLIEPGSSSCPSFGNATCNGNIIFSCYQTTGCYSGRQLSSLLLGPQQGTTYEVVAIADENGGYWNIHSQQPVDLNISIYQQKFSWPDTQLSPTVLAAGNKYTLYEDNYYIGVNSGNSVYNISTTTFFVCLNVTSL